MNILTIDVEDYFQVENFSKYITYKEWDLYECRVVENTHLILNFLNIYKMKATFFVLGWIAERFPELVKEIRCQGHEIASHGYAHTLVYKQTPQEFKYDLRKSLEILENIIQQPVFGYRAPSFSITNENLWALSIIEKTGLKYDASIFPVKMTKRNGIKNAEHFIHKLSQDLYEVPPATVRFLGKRWPVAGGGYFRLYPYSLTRCIIKHINQDEKRPVVVYLHPWELDSLQPRIGKADPLSRFRHYVNIDKNIDKFGKLLTDFRFTSISEYLRVYLPEKAMAYE